MDNLDAEVRDVGFEHSKALWVAVRHHDHTPIFHELRDVACFPAWRGACIEDFFSGLWIEKLTGNRSGWILNVAMAQIKSVGWPCVKFYKLRTAGQRPRFRISPEEVLAIDF